MRDIRFRGFGIDLKKWNYGSLVIDDDPSHIDHGVRIVSYKGSVRVDPDSVGQYTGKEDADGMPVYEGDILEVCNGSLNGVLLTSRIVVRWSDVVNGFNVPLWSADQDETHWYKIIGSKWQEQTCEGS